MPNRSTDETAIKENKAYLEGWGVRIIVNRMAMKGFLKEVRFQQSLFPTSKGVACGKHGV